MSSQKGGEALFKAMTAITGKEFGPGDMIGMGMQCLQLEKEFNINAGLTKEDDRLPEFFRNEPLSPNNHVFKITDEDLDSVFAS
jgi:aldehyde:ferredoxin oxidoreductase